MIYEPIRKQNDEYRLNGLIDCNHLFEMNKTRKLGGHCQSISIPFNYPEVRSSLSTRNVLSIALGQYI